MRVKQLPSWRTIHIHKFNPSLDEMRIFRVGGRLENALVEYNLIINAKHPIHDSALSRYRFNHLELTPEVPSSGPRISFVQPASSVLGYYQGVISSACSSCFLCKKNWCHAWGDLANAWKERILKHQNRPTKLIVFEICLNGSLWCKKGQTYRNLTAQLTGFAVCCKIKRSIPGSGA